MTDIKTICFIGAGNVATHLADAVARAGYSVNAVYSRQVEHAQNLARKVGAPIATDRLILLPYADVYVFSVKDSVLEEVVRAFSQVTKNSEALYVHTAGSMPLSVLADTFKNAAVFYPMQTFSKNRKLDFKSIPVFVEANCPENLDAVTRFAQNVSERVVALSSEKRKKLHLSAVFACNFANHCYNLAFNLLESEQIDPTCLLSLIDETTSKIHEITPHAAQTGPAVRWDENVMKSQIEQLKAFPEMQSVYEVMSASIHKEFSH